MIDAIGAVLDRKAIAALVRFSRVAVEDKPKSKELGHYFPKDVDMVAVTPPYSKDEQLYEAADWLVSIKHKVDTGGISPEQYERYLKQYEAWKNGQELPLEGTPIKGWPMLSPAQQELLISLGVPTVEHLAQLNDEGAVRIGMGSIEMKRKAAGWLQQAKDKGPLTQEIASVKQENDVLKLQLEALHKQFETLQQHLQARTVAPPPADPIESLVAQSITEKLSDSPKRRR